MAVCLDIELPVQQVGGAGRLHARGPGGKGQTQRLCLARAVEVQRQVERIEDRLVAGLGDEAAPRIMQVQVEAKPARSDRGRQGEAARSVKPSYVQRDGAVGQVLDRHPAEQRLDAAHVQMAIDGEHGGHADDGRLEDQPAHMQLVEIEAEIGQAAGGGSASRLWLGGGRRHRPAPDRDLIDRSQRDVRIEAEQVERMPVEGDAVQHGVDAEMVAERQPADRQRVGKGAVQAVDGDRTPGQRGCLPFDQPPSGAGVGADQHHQQGGDHQPDGHADEQAQDPEHDPAQAMGRGHQKSSPSPI